MSTKRKHSKTKRKKRHPILFRLLLLVEILVIFIFAMMGVAASCISSLNTTPLSDTPYIVENDVNMQDYTNIALFGVDTRSQDLASEPSRSDSIIIVSIHNKTKDVRMTSIYRDSYVSIDRTNDSYGAVMYTKLNHAYAYGGPLLSLSTINRNYDLNITKYATVNFKIMANIIDAIGGVSLEIESDFIDDLNKYIKSVNHYNGGNSPGFTTPGTYVLDGNQAVAYSRIRHNQNGDISRADRQRKVLQAISDTAKRHPVRFVKAIREVLPQVQTNLSSNDLMKMLASAPKYNITKGQGFPYEHTETRLSDGIYYDIPTTLESNVVELHRVLFGTENYRLAEQAYRINQKIINQTGFQ